VSVGTFTSDPSRRLLKGRELERLGWQHRVG
jgi:hypothetical protein